jgi:hypothetical protein
MHIIFQLNSNCENTRRPFLEFPRAGQRPLRDRCSVAIAATPAATLDA